MEQFLHMDLNTCIISSKIRIKRKHCQANNYSIDLLDMCLKLRFHYQYLCVLKRVNGFPNDELSSCQRLFCCQSLSVYNACSLITLSRGSVSFHKLTRVVSVQNLNVRLIISQILDKSWPSWHCMSRGFIYFFNLLRV